MAMTEEEKRKRRVKRFKSAHPSGKFPSNVTDVSVDRVQSKASPFMTLHGPREDVEVSSKKKLSPTALEGAPLDLTRPEPKQEKPLFDKIDKIIKKAVDSGDAEKATEIKLNKKEKAKVKSIIKDPRKVEKAISKTEKHLESGKAPKKDDMASMFTGALYKSLPLLIGSVVGGLDVGIAAQEGANKAEADIAAAKMADRGMKVKEDEVDVKEAQLAQQQKQFEKEQHMKRLGLMQKISGEKIKSQQEAEAKFVGSKLFGNYTALGNDKAAQTLRDNVTNVENTVDGLNRIMSLSENITLLDRDRRAATEQEIAKIVGKLRIPITGPGAFTDSEREFIKDLIGDPSKISSLESTERVKLEQLVNSSMSDMRNTLQNNTVEGKAQLQAYQALKQRGYTDEQIQERLNGR